MNTSDGENPYKVQRELQETMQHNVGIVRDESEMQAALEHLKAFWERARKVGVTGNRDFNPGWHTALDLQKSAHGFRSHHPRGLGTKGKPRRAVSRGLPGEERGVCESEHDRLEGRRWRGCKSGASRFRRCERI